eukprot:g2864.t1
MKAQMEQRAAEMEELAAIQSDLLNDLKDANRRVSEEERKREEIAARHSSGVREIEDLKRQLDSLVSARNRDGGDDAAVGGNVLRASLESERKMSAGLRSEIAWKARRIKDLERQLVKMEGSVGGADPRRGIDDDAVRRCCARVESASRELLASFESSTSANEDLISWCDVFSIPALLPSTKRVLALIAARLGDATRHRRKIEQEIDDASAEREMERKFLHEEIRSLQTKLDDANGRVEPLRRDLTDARARFRKSREMVSAVRQTAKTEIAALAEAKVAQETEMNAALSSALKDAQRKAQEAMLDLKGRSDRERSELLRTVRALEQAVAASTKAMEDAQSRHAKLARVAEERESSASDDAVRLAADAETYRRELERAQAKCADSQRSLQRVEAERRALRAELSDMESTTSKQRATLASKESETDAMRTSMSQMADALEAVRSMLGTKLEAIKLQYHAHAVVKRFMLDRADAVEPSTFSRLLPFRQQSRQGVDDVSVQFVARQIVELLDLSLAHAATSDQQIEMLQNRSSNAEAQTAAAVGELRNLRLEIESCRSVAKAGDDKVEVLNREKTNAERRARELDDSIKSLKLKLESVESKVRRAQSTEEQLRVELGARSETAEANMVEAQELRRKVSELATQLHASRRDTKDARSRLAEATRKIDSIEAASVAARSAKDAMKKRCARAERELQDARRSIANMKSQMSRTSMSESELRASLRLQRSKAQEREKALSHMASEQNALQSQVARDLNDLHRKHERVLEQYTAAARENRRLDARLQTLNREMTSERRNAAEARRQERAQAALAASLRDEITKLETRLRSRDLSRSVGASRFRRSAPTTPLDRSLGDSRLSASHLSVASRPPGISAQPRVSELHVHRDGSVDIKFPQNATTVPRNRSAPSMTRGNNDRTVVRDDPASADRGDVRDMSLRGDVERARELFSSFRVE